MERYADIIIHISHEAVDRIFQYRIPEHLYEQIQIGSLVIVPFGNGNRVQKGYVVGITTIPSFDVTKIKNVISIEEKGVTLESQLIQLASWLKEQYGSTMIQALKTVLPVKEKMEQKENRVLELRISKEEAKEKLEEYEKKHYTAKVRLLKGLMQYGKVAYSVATKQWKATKSVIQSLE